MTPTPHCLALIKTYEGCRLTAYQCPAGVWTIGYGTIRYEGGAPVKAGDTITQPRAELLLEIEVGQKARKVEQLLLGVKLNTCQFDALVSFAYNLGEGALAGSSLLRYVKNNPRDEAIRGAFLAWNKARVKGVLTPLPGLTKRRQAEADLYFS